MSNKATAVTSAAFADPFDDPVTSNKMAVRALIPLTDHLRARHPVPAGLSTS